MGVMEHRVSDRLGFLRWPRVRFDAWSGLVAASRALTALPAWAQQPAAPADDVTLEAGRLPVPAPPPGVPLPPVDPIIEDEAFIGSRCMVTEGARVGTGAMLGAGVILNPSIPVIDTETGEEVSRGVVPPWSLVINGTRPKEFPGGMFGLPCCLIIKRFAEGERHDKAALNDVLREHGVAT